MRKKLLAGLLCSALMLLCLPVGAADLSARSAIVIEAHGETAVYEKNADERLPMASTTKIMTALCAIESGRLYETVSVSPDAVGVEGSSVYLKAGDKLTLDALVRALMLESANDAAEAIAIAVAGSVEDFCTLMNRKAAEIGLLNTRFSNPHGLSDENHYTTARELARLAAYAMRNDTFREIVSLESDTVIINGVEKFLKNHNKMLRLYDGAVGIKTGFTKVSGRCLVSAAERDGLMLVAVTLDAPDDWNDHTKMLDLGFSSLCREVLIPDGEFSAILPCLGGEADSVHIKSAEGLSVILPKKHSDITAKVMLPHYVWAPVEKNDTVGRLEFYCDGAMLGSVRLYAADTVGSVLN